MMTSASHRRPAPTRDRRRTGRGLWTTGLARALCCAAVVVLFGGLACHDDDDCHTHVACCGGVTVIRHCHSGGGHDHPGYNPASQVAVLATDAPGDDVRSLYVTVTEITLESGETHPQVLYRSETGQRLDLLALRGSRETRLYELLAAPSLVHAATYDAIWISVKDPTVVVESGEVVATADIELDGSIDVVFREPVFLGPEDAAFLVLDFDVKRSLFRIEASDATAIAPREPARWRFRPLILAHVIREEVAEELLTPTDIEGTVDELDPDGETLYLDLPDGRGSVTVHAHRGTVLRGPELERLRFEDLRLGKTVRVRGLWRPDGGLDALSLLEGSTFRVTGRIDRVERDGIVVRVATDGDPRETTIRVTATRDTLLSFGRVETAQLPDLEAGLEITTIGYRDPGPGDVRTAALVDLRRMRAREDTVAAERASSRRIAGMVARIERESRTIVLRSGGGDGSPDRELQVPHGSEILFLERRDGVLWQTPGHFEQIRPEMRVEVETLPGDGSSPGLYLFHLAPE